MFQKRGAPGLLPSKLLPYATAVPPLDGLLPACRCETGPRAAGAAAAPDPLDFRAFLRRNSSSPPTRQLADSQAGASLGFDPLRFPSGKRWNRLPGPSSHALLPPQGKCPRGSRRFGVSLHPPAQRPRRTGSPTSPGFLHLVSPPAASASRHPGLSFRLRRRVRLRLLLAFFGCRSAYRFPKEPTLPGEFRCRVQSQDRKSVV